MKIITHAGAAHADEVNAIAIILAKEGNTDIIRVPHIANGTPEKYGQQPGDYIVDIGLTYNPANKQFDHHQDKNLNSSFYLILDHYGITDAFDLAHPWGQAINNMDIGGPKKVAKHYGLETTENIEHLISTLIHSGPARYLVNAFSKYDQRNPQGNIITASNPLNEILRGYGQELLEVMENVSKNITQYDQTRKVETINGYTVIDCTNDQTSDFASGSAWERKNKLKADVIVAKSNRMDGIVMTSPRNTVDFRALEPLKQSDPTAIPFIHATGFTTTVAADKWREYLEYALANQNREIADIAQKMG